MIISDFFTKLVKRISALVCACAMLVFLPAHISAQTRTLGLDRAIEDSAQYLFEQLPEGSIIAVYGFRLPSNAKPELSEYLVEELTTLFSRESRFSTANRQQMEVVKAEMGLHLSGDISDETAKSLGKQLGADFVITGHIIRTGRVYRLTVRPITVETNQVFPTATADIPENDLVLNSFLEQKVRYISLGGRAGMSLHLWTLSNDIIGNVDHPSPAFEPAIHGAFHVTNFFAVQTEIALSMDTASYSGDDSGEYTASFESYSLRVPLLARFTYNPNKVEKLFLGGFVGIGFNIPLGAMDVKSNVYNTSSYRFSLPLSYIVGANVGWKLGPGILFSDMRFSGDFLQTLIIDNAGSLAVYRRNTLSFSLGYEYKFRWGN